MTNPQSSAKPESSSRILVALCDRRTLLRSALERAIASQPDMQICWSVPDVSQALDEAQSVKPALLLIDFTSPTIAFLKNTREFLSLCPQTRFVALTDHGSDACWLFKDQPVTIGLGEPRTCCLQQAFMLGARGAVSVTGTVEELLRVIRQVLEGQIVVEQPSLSVLLSRLMGQQTNPAHPHLTEREQEVIQQLVKGKSNKEIGQALGIGEQTVKNHISSILAKLGLEDRLQIVVYAARQGLVSLDDF